MKEVLRQTMNDRENNIGREKNLGIERWKIEKIGTRAGRYDNRKIKK